MSSWPAAVLFDFDGVIVNSEPLHFWAFHEVLRGEHLELSEAEYYNELIGFDDKGAFKHVFAKHGRELDPRTFLRAMTRKSEMMMDLIRARKYATLPGVDEFVRGLWWRYPLAICSGALREEIEAMLEGVGLRDCFKVIVAAEDVTVGKPDPSGYLLCAQQLGAKVKHELRPADCLIIEDAPTVIRSVKTVGFRTLAVATSYPVEKLADANYIVKDLRPATVTAAVPELKLGAA
ncbi:MAG TPA: HAD family phosphatase [Tepidisphaeraceae bacterium]|jgi:beta-phosphoglucomutase